MEFMIVSTVMIGLVVLALVLIARAYPGSGADLVDWKPTRSYETEAQLEMDDVQQMMEAQNKIRRRRGKPEMTGADLDKIVAEDEAVRQRANPAYTEAEDVILDEGLGPGESRD